MDNQAMQEMLRFHLFYFFCWRTFPKGKMLSWKVNIAQNKKDFFLLHIYVSPNKVSKNAPFFLPFVTSWRVSHGEGLFFRGIAMRVSEVKNDGDNVAWKPQNKQRSDDLDHEPIRFDETQEFLAQVPSLFHFCRRIYGVHVEFVWVS